ncbi:hypothetical protein ORD22_11655 [Sporosarcina sp. GW1-11]|uniref:hypothetical protein n=1 Tax=Sporosarcina sp. GW1-11 TaxID=2899126 RepID=UPI00294E519C|nr:hypothetical protein [Sporosarcina sp. GW1-11]MDV6378871.1 hypothetical protein [Sporosarcina sp. GW1-11]
MEIRILEKGYRNNVQFYKDFLNGTIEDNDDYFSDETVNIKQAPDFPIYIAYKNEDLRKELFLKAFETMEKYYLTSDRELHLDGRFWHSLLLLKKREFLLNEYPEIKDSIENFNKIVVKKFDWENYIYKSVLAAEYISDMVADEAERKRYYEIIIDNLDLYNYMIKYEVFRSKQFVFNILTIVDELGISSILKKKIKGRDDLGADTRIGRQVLFEFNKNYPVVMSPMLEKDDLKELFVEYLGYYTSVEELKVLV